MSTQPDNVASAAQRVRDAIATIEITHVTHMIGLAHDMRLILAALDFANEQAADKCHSDTRPTVVPEAILKDAEALGVHVLRNLPGYRLMSDEHVGRLRELAERTERAEAELAKIHATLQSGLDRDKDDSSTLQLATIAANGLAMRDQLRAEVERLTKKQPINTHVRLFDLVRFMRSELHQADLITSDEYAWLCTHTFPGDPESGSPSPRRLEDYDNLRAQLAAAQEDSKRLDWLESNGKPDGYFFLREERRWVIDDIEAMEEDVSLRAAIDAARKEVQP